MKKIFVGLMVVGLLALPVAPLFAQQYYNVSTPYNVNPVWRDVSPQTLTVPQGQTFTTTFQAEDANGDWLIYSAVQLPTGAAFNPITRVFTFTPNSNQLGSFPVVLSVTDSKSAAIAKTFYINVTSAVASNGYYYYNSQYQYRDNQPPYFSATQSYYEITSGNSFRFTLRANDPNNDPIYFEAASLPIGASLNNSTGEFSWTPRPIDRGIYTMIFTARDVFGASVPMNVTIVVDGGNRSSVIVAPSGQSVTYNAGTSYGSPVMQAYQYYPSAQITTPTYAQPTPTVTYTVKPVEEVKYVYRDTPAATVSTSYAQYYPTTNNAQTVSVSAGRVIPTYAINSAASNSYTSNVYGALGSVTLETFNIAVRAGDKGDMLVTWDTSKPAKSELVFGYASHPRSDTWNNILNYDFTTGEDTSLVTRHQVSLGKLELGRTYYLRVISRTDRETNISREIVFIPMETESGQININQYNGAASAASSFATLITSTGALTLLGIIALGLLMYAIYVVTARRPRHHPTATTMPLPDFHIKH